MATGAVITGVGLGEVTGGVAGAIPTGGASLLALIEAPFVTFFGIGIIAGGLATSAYGVKLMWDSNAPQWAIKSIINAINK
jgi:hypothetical protein